MKVPKEQIPKLLGELVNRERNIATMKMVEEFLGRLSVSGKEIRDVAQCMQWAEAMAAGEQQRIDEIKAVLPDQSGEIKMGEEPAPDKVSMGTMEIEKGEPVLGGAPA